MLPLNPVGETSSLTLLASGTFWPTSAFLGLSYITSISASVVTWPSPHVSLPSHGVLFVSMFKLPSSSEDISYAGLWPTLMVSSWLHYICKGPISQKRSYSEVLELRIATYLLGEHNSNHNRWIQKHRLPGVSECLMFPKRLDPQSVLPTADYYLPAQHLCPPRRDWTRGTQEEAGLLTWTLDSVLLVSQSPSPSNGAAKRCEMQRTGSCLGKTREAQVEGAVCGADI